MEQSMGQLLTTAQVAQMLGRSQRGIRKLIVDGRLIAMKFGRDYLIDEDNLSRILPVRSKGGRPKQNL